MYFAIYTNSMNDKFVRLVSSKEQADELALPYFAFRAFAEDVRTFETEGVLPRRNGRTSFVSDR